MTDDPHRQLVAQLGHLLEQAADPSAPVLPRISTAIAAGGYLEALTRQLVGEAREKGHSWEDLAGVFATSPANVQYRFGTVRQYDDD
ncbi:MAG: hypothetical protein M3N68_06340 [Actinomycetota bacterium]|nr:hypothetical protein [Actinomycetota bacterium]